MKGYIQSVKHFSLFDGPGIRTTVCLSDKIEPVIFSEELCIGCGRCMEVCKSGARRRDEGKKTFTGQLCNGCGTCLKLCNTGALRPKTRQISIEKLMTELTEDEIYYKSSGGGITLSLESESNQQKFIEELLNQCVSRGWNTGLKLTGKPDIKKLYGLFSHVDFVIYNSCLYDLSNGLRNENISRLSDDITKHRSVVSHDTTDSPQSKTCINKTSAMKSSDDDLRFHKRTDHVSVFLSTSDKDKNGDDHESIRQRAKLLLYRGFEENSREFDYGVRKAKSIKYLFENYPVIVDDRDWLAGRPYDERLSPREEKEWSRICAKPGEVSYIGPIDLENVLIHGVRGILDEIRNSEREVEFGKKDTIERLYFYKAGRIVMESIQKFARRFETELESRRRGSSDNCFGGSENCFGGSENYSDEFVNYHFQSSLISRVPREPAKNFSEALQSIWFVSLCLLLAEDCSLVCPLFKLTARYFCSDMEKGRISEDTAEAILTEFFMKIHRAFGPKATIILESTDKNLQNMTYSQESAWTFYRLCIQALIKAEANNLRIIFLADDESLENFLQMIGKLKLAGFFNVQLKNASFSYPQYDSIICESPVVINLADELSGLICNQAVSHSNPFGCKVDLKRLGDFESFLETYKLILREKMRYAVFQLDSILYKHRTYGSLPVISAINSGCLKRGKDVTRGGADNYSYAVNFTGFADMVDSLCAIREAVYERKKVSLTSLGEILKGNFVGAEDLRRFLVNRCPHYGENQPDADNIALEMMDFLCRELSSCTTCLEGVIYPAFPYSIEERNNFGRNSRVYLRRAIPNGKRRGERVQETVAPTSLRFQHGMTKAFSSICTLAERGNPISRKPVVLTLERELLESPEGRRAIMHLIRIYFKKGGSTLIFE